MRLTSPRRERARENRPSSESSAFTAPCSSRDSTHSQDLESSPNCVLSTATFSLPTVDTTSSASALPSVSLLSLRTVEQGQQYEDGNTQQQHEGSKTAPGRWEGLQKQHAE